MFTFLKRPLYVLSNKILRRPQPGEAMKEKWIADFSKPEKSCFDIKSEISYNAYLDLGSLFLGLKRKNCIAWLETADRYYEDQVIEARFRLDSLGSYAAAGLMFRIIGPGTYYMALISSKGYFRLDAVRDGSPRPLIGWTEAPGIHEQGTNLSIIASGDHFVFIVNGRWIAEAADDSIPGGHLGFALVSYEEEQAEPSPEDTTCRAWLDFLSVDSRTAAVEAQHNKWNDSEETSAESRLRLAETFAALDRAAPALDQITKAWERREQAARSVTATYTEMRTRRELLLAARMAAGLGQYGPAEEYINACIAQGIEENEAREVFAEKAKILSEAKNYTGLKNFLPEYIAVCNAEPADLSALYALLGHAHFNLNEYEAAAAAWDRAFELNRENGLYAAHAANAYEHLDKKEEALRRCLESGRIFLRQDNNEELGALIPRMLSLGEHSWEAHALAGKWAFGIEHYQQAETELSLSDSLRQNLRPLPEADPAVSYLRGLLSLRRDNPRSALQFFQEAVRIAPDYGLFRFKAAETRYQLNGKAHDPGLADDLEAARRLMPDDEQVRDFAGLIDSARRATPPPPATHKEALVEKTPVMPKTRRTAAKKPIPADKPAAKPPVPEKKKIAKKTARKDNAAANTKPPVAKKTAPLKAQPARGKAAEKKPAVKAVPAKKAVEKAAAKKTDPVGKKAATKTATPKKARVSEVKKPVKTKSAVKKPALKTASVKKPDLAKKAAAGKTAEKKPAAKKTTAVKRK
jgi:tetratricopeptide (TPR) repeat protein